MKKYLLLLVITLISGCMSLGVSKEYKSYQNDFYKLVSNPFKESQRRELENQFKSLKKRVQSGDYSKKEKMILSKDIDYYLMVLEDLKD
ncbi:hypothetical protein [uncultured Cetobacterium sp.]|uniref:hypothetical protein n=1 Tax=uncultured Cetobacterium sp. TaxID=527638 RepID=UPI0026226C0B|nr:hypothetical protein [uncultured Cetobacterium sp.]